MSSTYSLFHRKSFCQCYGNSVDFQIGNHSLHKCKRVNKIFIEKCQTKLSHKLLSSGNVNQLYGEFRDK